jgi:hypothetical protein
MAKTLASQARDGGSIPLARSADAMPRWTDLTPDQCADVRVARDLVAYERDRPLERWSLDGVGVAELRPVFGAPDEDPMYDGWEVGGEHAARIEVLSGRRIDLAGGATWTVEASGQLAARLALEGPEGFLFLELLDHRRLGVGSDGWVLLEANLSLFGPHVCMLPWFAAPAAALDSFCAQLAGGDTAVLELDGSISVEAAAGAFRGRIGWPDWADLRFGPVPFDAGAAAASAEAFRPVLTALT